MHDVEKCIAALVENKNQFDPKIYTSIKNILLSVMQNSEYNYNKIELYNTTFFYDAKRDKITAPILEELLRIDEHNREKSMIIVTEENNWYVY